MTYCSLGVWLFQLYKSMMGWLRANSWQVTLVVVVWEHKGFCVESLELPKPSKESEDGEGTRYKRAWIRARPKWMSQNSPSHHTVTLNSCATGLAGPCKWPQYYKVRNSVQVSVKFFQQNREWKGMDWLRGLDIWIWRVLIDGGKTRIESTVKISQLPSSEK